MALRLAIVTNIPAPYRMPVFDRVAAMPGIELRVLYAARREPDRLWDLPLLAHEHRFLPGRVIERGGRYIHLNPAVWGELSRFAPEVVVTTGYNPTHLLAWLHARSHHVAHVAMSDGTDLSEARLGPLHRALRRRVLASSAAGVVASDGGERLMRSYGVPADRIHRSPLCANSSVNWVPPMAATHDVDLLFSGRLVADKNPDFALRVAAQVGARLGRRVRLALLGAGPLHDRLRADAATCAGQVEVLLPGHVAQADVPGWFHRARVFVFPTRWDPWGVVANEACQAGVPVLISPHAGAAGELVRDGEAGRVLALDEATWAEATVALLSDPDWHARCAAAARAAVRPYSFDRAAAGIVDAARQARS